MLLVMGGALAACSGGTQPSDGSGPRIVSLAPNTCPPQWARFTLIVNGTGFDSTSTVEWNGRALPTIVESSIRVRADVNDSDVAVARLVQVRVDGPGGVSAPARFTIAPDAVLFGLDSLSPWFDAEANPGAAVVVFFNTPVDTSSISDQTITVTEDGVPIPPRLSYDPARRAAVLGITPGPLKSYAVHLSDLIRSKSGGALTGPIDWRFHTSLSPIARVDLSGDFTSLALTAGGLPHIAYRGAAGTMLARCSSDCTRGGWSAVTLNAVFGAYVSLAISGDGTDNVTFQGYGMDFIHGTAPITTVEGGGAYTSLFSDGLRFHVAYYSGQLRHATCALACTSVSSWTPGAIDTGSQAGAFSSIATDPSHGVHVVYFENSQGDLRYGFCPGPCVTNSWTTTTIDSAGKVGVGASLAVDGSGGLHVAYFDDSTGWVKYAQCPINCVSGNAWTITPVAPTSDGPLLGGGDTGFRYTSIAIGPGGRVNVVYQDVSTGSLHATSCASGCSSVAGWQTTVVSSRGHAYSDSYHPSLKVDALGVRHVAWSAGNGLLYTEF